MAYSRKNPKPQHFNTPGHAHDLTFTCFKNQTFLKSKIASQLLADAINAASKIHNFEVWAYVFMPDHVHLLIFPTSEHYSISNILKSIKQSTSQAMIAHLKENNSKSLIYLETGLEKPKYRFWQDGGGYDRNYWDRKELMRQVDYIHNNPVRKGLAEIPEDWNWSSAGYWLTGTRGPVVVETKNFPMI